MEACQRVRYRLEYRTLYMHKMCRSREPRICNKIGNSIYFGYMVTAIFVLKNTFKRREPCPPAIARMIKMWLECSGRLILIRTVHRQTSVRVYCSVRQRVAESFSTLQYVVPPAKDFFHICVWTHTCMHKHICVCGEARSVWEFDFVMKTWKSQLKGNSLGDSKCWVELNTGKCCGWACLQQMRETKRNMGISNHVHLSIYMQIFIHI